ncbi:hypothetical protein CPB85DRAFT_154295 [Mucidula mucida]|nr:hypothetical protein CPB85DRAFT_154295 [Mucidula mucida]
MALHWVCTMLRVHITHEQLKAVILMPGRCCLAPYPHTEDANAYGRPADTLCASRVVLQSTDGVLFYVHYDFLSEASSNGFGSLLNEMNDGLHPSTTSRASST